MNLRKNLSFLLKEHKITIAELSRKSGVPKSTIADWMTSQKSINLDQLRKVSEALKVPMYRLAFELDEADPWESSAADEILSEVFSGRLQVTIHRVERKK